MPRTPRVRSALLFVQRARLRWRFAACVFASSFLLIAIVVLLLPSTYSSRISIAVGNVGEPARPFGRINTEIQTLTSDEILRGVVVQSHLAPAGPASRPQQQAALRRLHAALAVTAFRGPDLVEMTYQAKTPDLAADVLRSIARAYAGTHRITPVPDASPALLQSMAASTHARLAAARTDLGRFRKAHQVAQPATTLAQADLQLTAADAATLRSLQRRIADLQTLDQGLRARLAQARLVARLDVQAVATLGAMQPSAPQLVSAPPRAFLLVCGLLASLLLAAATALALEFLSDRLHTRSSVEQATGIPVLAAIPPNAVAPAFQAAFPALYLAMQRPVTAFEGKLS